MLAFLLVWFALVAPNQISQLTPGAFVRIPVEGLIVLAVVLVLPARPSRVVAALVGVAPRPADHLKILDMGFFEALDRPFNPVTDWGYFGPAIGLLERLDRPARRDRRRRRGRGPRRRPARPHAAGGRCG